ncbi:MAG: BRO family protein [Nanoarchaeota archaeon]
MDYSVTDIVAILTERKDELAYWRKLKEREPQLVTICHGFKLAAKDGKMRFADCVNTKGVFRLIQSIPSQKAEPFKQWLAQVGYDCVQETCFELIDRESHRWFQTILRIVLAHNRLPENVDT